MFENVDSVEKGLVFTLVGIFGGLSLCGAVTYFIVKAAQYLF